MAARKPAPEPENTPEERTPENATKRFRYTNPHPLIFPNLHAGTTSVEYADDENTPNAEPGALLVLHEGDIVTLPADTVHAWLAPEEEK